MHQRGIRSAVIKNKDILDAWQKGLKESSHMPLVNRQLAKKGEGLFFSFKEQYEELMVLPRRVRRAMQRKWKHSLAGVALLLVLGIGPAMAGTTINVNGGNVADLIQAINDANSEVVPFDGADTIVLDGSTFTLDAVDNSTFGDNGLPAITSEIIIEGNGSTIERDATASDFRIFLVDGEGGDNGNLTLNETTVSGGFANGGSLGDKGGAIFSYSATTTITNSTISGNDATDEGGGIYNFGTLTITDSTISGNTATNDGGGIDNETTATITNSTISGNMVTGMNGDGGGISNDESGILTVTDSTISGNTAIDNGGGIFNDNELTITNSTISGNMASGMNGDGGGIFSEFETTTVTNSTISGNSAGDDGGGITSYYGTTIITNSTVSGNDATDAGGGIRNLGNTTTITDSTISGNSSTDDGGGIFNYDSTISITNSTVSGNMITGINYGAGIYSFNGTTTITSSTITGNSTNGDGGGIFSYSTTTISNSIVSGNTAVTSSEINNNFTFNADDFNLFGNSSITNAQAFSGFTPGVNDITATSDGTTPTALANILNTTLANNGGPTQTHALVIGSPAIDAIPPANCPPPATDQRGVTRPQGESCDSGSFELSEVSIMPGAGNVFASISLDPTVAGGGGQVIINLPPEVQAEAAQLVPNVGNCDIQTTTVTCNVDNFPANLDLIVDLCRDGDQMGTAEAVVRVLLDDQPAEEFQNFIEILLAQLQACQGDGGSGCTIAPVDKTSSSSPLSNFLITLIPAVFGFVGLFRRKRK